MCLVSSVFNEVNFEKFRVFDRKFSLLRGDVDVFTNQASEFILNKEVASGLLGSCGKIHEELDAINSENYLEKLIKRDLANKLNAVEAEIRMYLNADFSYSTLLAVHSLSVDDIEGFYSSLRGFDFGSFADEVHQKCSSLSMSSVVGQKDRENAKAAIRPIIEMCYASSPEAGSFRNFDEYEKLIDYVSEPNARSNANINGKVTLSFGNFFNVKKAGTRTIPEFDLVSAAKLAGEECLLGHQGHFMTSYRRHVLDCLCKIHFSSTSYNETVGRIGSFSAADMVIQSGMIKEKMPFFGNDIEIFHEYKEKQKAYSRIFNMYLIYNIVSGRRSKEEILKEYSNMTGDLAYMSEKYSYPLINDGLMKFWKKPKAETKDWGYVARDQMIAETYPKIHALDADKRKLILNDLHSVMLTYPVAKEYIEHVIKYHARR